MVPKIFNRRTYGGSDYGVGTSRSMKIPKTLRVTREGEIKIKSLTIGTVEKIGKTWEFKGTIPEAPPTLTEATVKAIKEKITAHIPRDTYMRIVESLPE